MVKLTAELHSRWQAIFEALAAGDDVPPAQRLRAEGLMEAAHLLGIADTEDLQVSMDHFYRDSFGRGLSEEFGEGWRKFFPLPQIPAMAKRAPVIPSTKE